MNKVFFIIFLLFIGHSVMASSDYFDDRERGWFFYEESPIEEEIKKEEPKEIIPQIVAPTVSTPNIEKELTPREILKKQGEELEHATAKAMLNPSPENYREYLRLNTEMQEQAMVFAKGVEKSIWLNPQYDYSLQKPRNTDAIMAYNQHKNKTDDNKIYELAENRGLIFFFRSDCPFCHKFAPVLKSFSDKYGFTVIPVSMDGKGLPEYPYPKKNYDMGKKLKVAVVPAVFMIEPSTGTVTTVSYGFAGWAKFASKILFAGSKIFDSKLNASN